MTLGRVVRLFAVLGVTGFAPHALAQTNAAAPAIQASLAGQWQGSSLCRAAPELMLRFDKAEVQGSTIVLRGTAKSEPRIDANVVGKYDLTSGLLSIDGTVVPDDPDYCAGQKVLGKCMQLTVGSLITPQKTMQKHQEERAALARTSTFAIDVVRSEQGSMRGTVRGAAFDCPDFQLVRVDRAAPTALLLQSMAAEEAALGRVDGSPWGSAADNARARGVWLDALARRGDPIAMAELGRQFEAGASRNPAKAAEWYLKAAQAGEARAQRRLAEMYAKGDGVARNPGESDRWSKAAKATAAYMGRYCVAPAMLDGYMELFDSLKKDSSSILVGAATTMLTGIALQEGEMSIEGAGIEDVTVRDGPFLCRIVARRVGASARNVAPSFTYAGDDSSGTALYYDNRGAAASNEAIASITTQLMSRTQMTQGFQVVPLGGNRFRVTLVQQLVSTGHTHATEVVIDPSTLVSLDRPAAPPSPSAAVMPPSAVPAIQTVSVAPSAAASSVPAPAAPGPVDPQRERAVWSLCQSATSPAMCQAYLAEFPSGPHSGQAKGILSDMSAGPATPSQAARAPVAATTIDASGRDDPAIVAAVNAGFMRWSREWTYDHYLGNTVKLQDRRCGGAACQVAGNLQFQRMGRTLSLAYTANVARQPDGRIVPTRVCYADPSSGQSDCRDFQSQ